MRSGRCHCVCRVSALASHLMPSLLHNLLLDLKRRGECVLQELTTLQNLSPSFDAHRTTVVARLNRALLLVEQLLNDPDLADPKLEPNFFMDFKRLSELILNVEDSSLLILKRCSQEDRFLSALLQQICREVGYKEPAPLCGALSFQYFQALMGMDIIMTPQTQASELLALPDLYHELAHFVVKVRQGQQLGRLRLRRHDNVHAHQRLKILEAQCATERRGFFVSNLTANLLKKRGQKTVFLRTSFEDEQRRILHVEDQFREALEI